MKKSTQMRKDLETLKNSIAALQASGKIEEAHNKLSDLNELKNAIAVQEALEDDEDDNFAGEPKTQSEDVNKTVVFNKLVLGKELTEAEQSVSGEFYNGVGTPGQAEHTPDKGGYLVPEEQYQQIKELKRRKTSLKDYCAVYPVTSMSGKMPLEVDSNDKLTNFEELNEIAKSDITFGQVKWDLKDYGDIIPVSNTLLEDETANLTDFIGRRFAKKAVNTENDEILKVVKTAQKVTGTSYEDIKTVLNTKLDPAVSEEAVIITNQTGFDFLDKLKDKNDRPILSDDLTNPTKKLFKGREIVVLTDAELVPAGGKKQTFYIGDLEEAVAFFDKKGVEVAVSAHAGFKSNATLMRAIERFDVKPVDTKAIVHLEITVG